MLHRGLVYMVQPGARKGKRAFGEEKARWGATGRISDARSCAHAGEEQPQQQPHGPGAAPVQGVIIAPQPGQLPVPPRKPPEQ